MAKEKKTSHPEAKGLICIGAALILCICLLSFKSGYPENNWLGLVGYGVAWTALFLFGLIVYPLIALLGFLGWKLLTDQDHQIKTVYFSLFLFSTAMLFNLIGEHVSHLPDFISSRIYSESITISHPIPHREIRYNLGGVPLYFLYRDLPTFNLQGLLSDVGIGITFTLTSIVSFLFLTELRLVPLIQAATPKLSGFLSKIKTIELSTPDEIEKSLTKVYPPPPYTPTKAAEPAPIKKIKREEKLDFTAFDLPPLSLLRDPKKVDQPTLKKDLRQQAEILEETLMSFGIEAKVGEINCGPTITSFEVQPAVGVKVQKITALENDIALNLQAKSLRIIAPIPGKAAVGVEIPSLYPQEVNFKEMLMAYNAGPRKHMIPILLGKTVSGDYVMSDLAKMPHCLIAGATGSGKSVCINTLVMSILMTARPDEVKLLMVDPKKVELTAYTNLPHMIAPVITEAHGAYSALNWLVKEMQLRYEILKQLALRNITAFNTRTPNKELEASLSMPIPQRMPAIVAIIDEFADLMMASSSDLETPIARIAQMARAVGIHLVLATQRPSREVITGLIKANFPTRIAFKVASRINSQIILDDNGAESLLGNGDMLFLPPGTSHLTRAQGVYISDEEINKVISHICNQSPTNYLIKSFDNMAPELTTTEVDSSRDTLYDQAYGIVVETGNASTTFLQRKLKIGYARAASLMDELEQKGVISPADGAKPRRILKGNLFADETRDE